MKLREATFYDLPALMLIGRDYWEFGGFGEHGLDFDDKSMGLFLANMIAKDDGLMLVADIDGQVVAVIGAYLEPWFMDLKQVRAVEVCWYVRRDCRGHGISMSLLNAYRAWAIDKGAACLSMASLPNEHQGNLDQFYTKNGFMPGDHIFVRRLG